MSDECRARGRGAEVAASEEDLQPDAGATTDSFFIETQSSDAQQRGSGGAAAQTADETGADEFELDDGRQWTTEEEAWTQDMDTADRLLARRRADEQSAQSATAAKPAARAGSRVKVPAIAKAGRKDGPGAARGGARKVPEAAGAQSAGEDLWAKQDSGKSAAAGGGESGAFVDTWDEKHKQAEQQ
jgi:hypothetical protein